ncbi:type IV pilus secretin PilQ [Arenimonas fontis]|uniref:Type IV pilus secretin PilQ n=2 Tax=Arenimonas fontis TaxID=2608255 RepID=A0A5B2ZEH5_9GAMM|nr:type IV pilus secretin PilQ [Arenimonas fontis]
MSLPALAANVLKDVRYAQAAGGKVDITLEFAEPVGDVQAFTTDTPPRIAVDLPDTTNALAQRRVVIGSGAASAVSAVESGGRTRVVVDLFRPAGYTARSAGNLLVLTVDAGVAQTSAANAMASGSDPTKKVASDLEVANIDFRRGENGSGRVILRFSGDGATADMRNEGSRVVVDVPNASIPESLRRHLDVTDFATPVTSLEPRANAGSTRLVINTNGAFESMAYQTGNEYVIEIAPKRGAAPMIAGAPGRAAGAVAGEAEARTYRGRPVTFNFQDVPVRTVLQLIAEESGLNVVAADTVQGNVTLRLINVPWDQAMDIVLRAKQLDKRREGNVIWVAPQKEIADFEKALADARIALEDREPLVTEYIPINYGNAQEIAELLTEGAKNSGGGGGSSTGGQITRGFLSPRGSVTADTRTNTLLIIDIPRKIDEIRTLLATLDRPVDQVLIEARIVIATEVFARELGAMFGIQDRVGTLPAAAAAGESTSDSGFLVDLPATTPAGVLNLSILRSDIALDLELSALEEEGRGEVVSNPRVITANQREAVIRQGDEVGYLTIQPAQAAGGVVTAEVEFKEVLLELKVTPTITQDGRVYLNLMVKKDEVSELIANPAGGFVPQIAKREVSTAVLVDNGQTVVVGGVYEFKNREDLRKVPWLGDVPVLGNLFRNKSREAEKAELLIFVTPRVLQVAHRG